MWGNNAFQRVWKMAYGFPGLRYNKFKRLASTTGWPHFIAAIALSIVLASLSWFLLERPLLKLKDRLAPRPDRAQNSGSPNLVVERVEPATILSQ